MRLAIIGSLSYRRSAGGTNAFVLDIINHINKGDVHVSLIGVTDDHREKLGRWTRRIVDGYSIPFLPIAYLTRNRNLLPARVRSLMNFLRFKRLIDNVGADIYYVHSPELVIPFVLIDKTTPVIYHMHGAYNPLEYSRYPWASNPIIGRLFDTLVTSNIIRRANKCIAINDDCLDLCYKVKGKNNVACVKIPVCVDTNTFYPYESDVFRSKRMKGQDEIIIIYIGRLAKAKGLDMLLDTLALAKKENRLIKLILIGDGEERHHLAMKCLHLGIGDKVIFLGRKSHDLIPDLLNSADVFVMTSHAEGVPIALLEAMACGLAVVCVNAGGISEVVHSGLNGYVISDRNPHLLLEFIKRSLVEKRNLGKNAVCTISQSYSAKHTSQLIIGVFHDFMS